jgi:hypothetical protein
MLLFFWFLFLFLFLLAAAEVLRLEPAADFAGKNRSRRFAKE